MHVSVKNTKADDRSKSEFWSSVSSSEERLLECKGLLVSLPLIPHHACNMSYDNKARENLATANRISYQWVFASFIQPYDLSCIFWHFLQTEKDVRFYVHALFPQKSYSTSSWVIKGIPEKSIHFQIQTHIKLDILSFWNTLYSKNEFLKACCTTLFKSIIVPHPLLDLCTFYYKVTSPYCHPIVNFSHVAGFSRTDIIFLSSIMKTKLKKILYTLISILRRLSITLAKRLLFVAMKQTSVLFLFHFGLDNVRFLKNKNRTRWMMTRGTRNL